MSCHENGSTGDKAVGYIKKAVNLQFLETNSPTGGICKILGVSQKAFDDMPQERDLSRLYSGKSYSDTATSGTFSPVTLSLSDILEVFSGCCPVGCVDISPPTVLPTCFFTTGSHLVQHPAW